MMTDDEYSNVTGNLMYRGEFEEFPSSSQIGDVVCIKRTYIFNGQVYEPLKDEKQLLEKDALTFTTRDYYVRTAISWQFVNHI